MAAAAGSSSSRFAVTCGLLRQYVRERQQQQPPTPVSLLATVAEVEEDDRTMQLFPPRPAGAVATTASAQTTSSSQAGTAPLTIFYDGRVLVFDDVPAEKAVELMKLAGSASSPAPVAEATPPPPPQTVQPASAALSEMPIARKASLQRFLQKRKHRIITSDPYKKAVAPSPAPDKSFAAVKPVKDEPATWLGL
ncbi:hypothetical protein E2562_017723 [Oryza meyeriana var. granulata]|uniref:Protein TIFY n=1 Tax=Oryza meyeriana var. granulata TaxID=110450 RepID=A0A6G1BXS2_9ORYZ|nr:hypothetical protein E2562_017723 [Oryza meyeriana var. granulata]